MRAVIFAASSASVLACCEAAFEAVGMEASAVDLEHEIPLVVAVGELVLPVQSVVATGELIPFSHREPFRHACWSCVAPLVGVVLDEVDMLLMASPGGVSCAERGVTVTGSSWRAVCCME